MPESRDCAIQARVLAGSQPQNIFDDLTCVKALSVSSGWCVQLVGDLPGACDSAQLAQAVALISLRKQATPTPEAEWGARGNDSRGKTVAGRSSKPSPGADRSNRVTKPSARDLRRCRMNRLPRRQPQTPPFKLLKGRLCGWKAPLAEVGIIICAAQLASEGRLGGRWRRDRQESSGRRKEGRAGIHVPTFRHR